VVLCCIILYALQCVASTLACPVVCCPQNESLTVDLSDCCLCSPHLCVFCAWEMNAPLFCAPLSMVDKSSKYYGGR
jgi:hypothetical protein